MINVYDSKEVNFNHNGLVVLDNCKSSFVTEENNGQFELELEYSLDSRGKWKCLTEGNVIKADDQLFRIYHKTKVLSGIKVNARHIFYDLLDNLVEEVEIRGLSGASALDRVMTNTAYFHKFTYMSDITAVNGLYIDDEVGDIINKNPIEAIFFLINLYGGELVRDNYNIKWLQQRGQDRGVLISYGKNIKGIEEDINIDSIITRIKPIGKDGLTLPEKYVDSPYINNYPNPKIKVIEFSDCNDYESLRAATQKYYKNTNCDVPPVNYKVDFIELSKTEEYKNYKVLERVYVGDTVTVRHTKLNISLKCKVIKIKKDAITKRIVEVELGNFKKTIADTLNIVQTVTDVFGKAIEGNRLSKSFLQSWVDNATNLILKGNDGHVIQDENGISIMDTTDKMTAQKVWRWNLNGLGYSSTGYNGPFNTAITADGKMVADFITAGELNGSILKAGSVKTSSLEVSAKQVIETTVPNLVNDNTNNKDAISTIETTIEAIPGQIDSKVSTATEPINENISGLDSRLQTAEQKITPEAITQTVTESNTYKSYALIPNKSAVQLTRLGLSINPLQAYNFTGGTIFQGNQLVSVESGIADLVYTADLQITGGEIVTFDKHVTRIEEAESQIKQTAYEITERVKNADFESYKTQAAGLISEKVSGGTFETYKSQTSSEIASKVASTDFNSFQSTMTQRASNIELSVSNNHSDALNYTDDAKSELESSINVQAERIDIVSSKVNINGTYFYADGTMQTEGLRGDVINLNYGYSIDNRSNGIRIKYNDSNYAIVRNGNVGFYINGIQSAEIRSDGVYNVENGVAYKLGSGGGAAVFS